MSVIQKWSKSIWVLLGSMLLGIIFGIWNGKIAEFLTPIGQIYLSLLQMSVLPIIITALISSLANLLHSKFANQYFIKVFKLFGISIVSAMFIALVVGLFFFMNSQTQSSDRTVLGSYLAQSNLVSTVTTKHAAPVQVFTELNTIIPKNIFYALSHGQNLPILFFCIVLGFALGSIKNDHAKSTIKMLECFQEAFLKIINWVLYLLPVGVCCLFASFIHATGENILLALGKVIFLIILAAIFIVLIYLLILWLSNRHRFLTTLRGLEMPLTIAFATSSSYACILPMLKFLQEDLKLNRDSTDFTVPLGINLHPPGEVLKNIIFALFMMHLYSISLKIHVIFIIFIMSYLDAVISSGIPGLASLSVIAIIMQPIGVPVTVAIVLATAVESIVDPFITVVNVIGNCAVSMLIAGYQKKLF